MAYLRGMTFSTSPESEAPETAPPGARWEAVRCTSLDDMRTQNIRFWQRQGGNAIRQAAWDLVMETWRTRGLDPNELRFQRLAPQLCDA